MESYTPKNFDEDKKPDKTGELSTSKKKKKKTSILPLPVETEAAKDASSSTSKKTSELFRSEPEEAMTEEENVDQEKTDGEAIELPEVTSTGEVSPYLGELIIDHTSEVDEETHTIPLENSVLPELEEPEAFEVLASEPAVHSEEALPESDDPTPVAPELLGQTQPDRPDAQPGGASFGELFDPSKRESVRSHEVPAVDTVPLSESNRRAYRAEKRGLSRGVTSGALAGWWLGRRSGRRQAERQQHTELQSRDQAIERIQTGQTLQVQEAKRRESVLQHSIDQLRASVQRNVVQAKEGVTKRESETVVPRPAQIERMPLPTEVPKVQMEQPKPPVEELPVTEEMLRAPEGHRFESSAWHRIEVSEKTGRLVEQPTQAYGEAFVQEQQQERLAREAAQSQTAAQVAMTLAAAPVPLTTLVQPQPQPFTAPPQYVDPAASESDAEFIKEQLLERSTSPVTWGIALLILVALLVSGAF